MKLTDIKILEEPKNLYMLTIQIKIQKALLQRLWMMSQLDM